MIIMCLQVAYHLLSLGLLDEAVMLLELVLAIVFYADFPPRRLRTEIESPAQTSKDEQFVSWVLYFDTSAQALFNIVILSFLISQQRNT